VLIGEINKDKISFLSNAIKKLTLLTNLHLECPLSLIGDYGVNFLSFGIKNLTLITKLYFNFRGGDVTKVGIKNLLTSIENNIITKLCINLIGDDTFLGEDYYM